MKEVPVAGGGADANPAVEPEASMEATRSIQQLAIESDESRYIESDDEDDAYRLLQNPTRERKLTEKKRHDTAVFQSWIENNQEEVTKASATTPEKSNSLTVAGMVYSNESKRIIASPREYQTDLFERAKKKNTIVVLDTGSGKTLIAALLLRHVVEKELEDRASGESKKVAFFLVEKVALCFQQCAVLECNLDHPIAKFYGNMTGIVNAKEFWTDQLEKNMVLVCTAQILLDCLNNGFVSMNQINLLIFDEAHHTKKNHPYSRIMKNHYMQTQGKKRPRILGMTASPVDANTRDVKAVAMELEGVLCSEIATVSNEVLLESQARKQQIETKESYEQLECPQSARTHLWCQIEAQVSHNAQFRAFLEFAEDAASTLGRWCADRFWQLLVTNSEIVRLVARTDRDFADSFGTSVSEKATNAIKEVQRLVNDHMFKPVVRTIPDLSTKVLTLRHVLEDAFTRDGTRRCIVFVEKRWTACILTDLFQQDEARIVGMDVAYMVGSQSTTSNLGNMSFREQILTLRRFKNGDINCLFATNVAEEGIDVPECDLIIRFDLYNSVIQYLQSKGRARQSKSKFVNMVEEGNMRHSRSLHQAMRDAGALRRFCSALPEDRKVQDCTVDTVAMALYEQACQKTHEIPSTGARLNFAYSLDVLSKFTSSLSVAGQSSAKPEYIITTMGKKFMADVVLPDASPIKSMSGFPQRSKLLAKCSAAFEACVELIKKKYINDHLQPIFAKKVPAMRNARLAVSSNKKDEYNMHIRPSVWESLGENVPTKLFATAIRLDDPEAAGRSMRSLLLLTRNKMPEFLDIPLFFGNDQSSLVKVTPMSESIHLTSDEINGLFVFTLKVFADVFSKEYDAKVEVFPYFLGPCLADGADDVQDAHSQLDWTLIQLVREKGSLDWDNAKDEFFRDKFVTDPWDGSRKFIIHGVNKLLRPSDPTPADAPKPKCNAYHSKETEKTIEQYSNSLWIKARKKAQWRSDQPVVNAELMSLRRNLLDEGEVAVKANNRCVIILEPLNVSPLPVDVVTMAMTFPAIIHRINASLIALDACALLDLKILPGLALEAFTKDSDNTGDHDGEQINFQSGMGNNYERLEFLGDTFLKMAVTIAIFTHFPHSDECEYHVERMLLICNQNLFNHAVDRKLQEYIRSKSFDRRTWYPNLPLKKGKAPKTQLRHTLANKTIADVCEALIGAAYLSAEPGNFDVAVKAVTKMVKGKNHKMRTFSDYYTAYKVPEWQFGPSSAAQRMVVQQIREAVGYEFKSPTLLRSAFKHPSYTYENIPNYQQLEFLGDALLDMAIVDYLYKRFPTADPQWLTEHKMAMVSNQFLGCVCVQLKFHKHLLLTTSSLLGQIMHYTTELEQAEQLAHEEAKENGEAPRRDFWVHASHPPKALPDIVEAFVGAMFVDAEYDYTVVKAFFTRFIQPYFEDMKLYDSFAARHPVTALSRKLQQELFCNSWSLRVSEVPCSSDQGIKALTQSDIICALIVHGNVVDHASAESGRYAKIAVAKKALDRFDKVGGDAWRKQVGCDCRASYETVLMRDEGCEENGTAI